MLFTVFVTFGDFICDSFETLSTSFASLSTPDITKSLDTEKINEFATRIRQLTSAIEPLTTQVSKAENGLVALNGIMKSSIARNGNLASANAVTVKSYTSLSSVFKDARIIAHSYCK